MLGNIMAACMVIGIVANIIEQPLILVALAALGVVFSGLYYNDR